MAYGGGQDDKREQVFWHIAPKQADHVAELIHKAIAHYLNGDIGNWFWTLTALREIVNHELTSDEDVKEGQVSERKGLDEMEKETRKYVKYWDRYSKKTEEGYLVDKDTRKGKAIFLARTRKYQRKLFDVLKALGYFPDKEDRSSLGF